MMRMTLLAGLALAAIAQPVVAQTVTDRARSAAEAARAKSSDSDALLRNYVTPGMSGEPVTTVDDSRTFTPKLSCQTSATMLEVLVQPAASGDLSRVTISRDRDLDGAFDSQQTLPMPISGLCANGVISCQPGTWSQCRYFRWDVDAASALKLSEGEMSDLSGCYCINNSCGTNLAIGNLPTVLKDLGGGMIGAITTADPRIGVAEARTEGPVISYVGAQTTACAASPAVGQTAYRTAPTTIQADAAGSAASNSIFQALAASPAGTGKVEQTRSCSVEREVTVRSWDYDDIVAASGQFQSVTSCGTGCRIYRIGGTGNCNDPPATYTARFTATRPERITSARITTIQTADWLQARVDGTPVAYAGKRPWLTNALPSGDCGVGDNYSAFPNYDFSAALKSSTTAIDARIRATGDHKSGYLEVQIQVDTSCETSERLVDLCSGYAADTHCRMKDETVDGVTTFANGVGTGLRPLAQTKLFGSASCTLQLTRDFFLRERRYACMLDTGSPQAPDLSRGAYIIDHSTETLLADQVLAPDGSHVASTRPFTLPDRGSVAACEAVCKTWAPKVNTGAAPAGVVASRQNDPAGWDTFYHACSDRDVCPTGPGEEIVSACGCLDDFPEAVVMMQMVRLSGADLACTAEAR